jgi:hypothetical protein
MDIKKALYLDFASELTKLDPTAQMACIVDDVFAEDNGLPTDEPFNVIAIETIQDVIQYTLDITSLGNDQTTIHISKDKLQLYCDVNETIETAKEFFEPYVDVSTVEDIYDLYDKLEDLEEYDEEEELPEHDQFNKDFDSSDY